MIYIKPVLIFFEEQSSESEAFVPFEVDKAIFINNVLLVPPLLMAGYGHLYK